IGEMNLKSQGKLLRVLDGCPHYRLGGTRKIEVNVRIIAATNVDLEQQVPAGKFRADLFHRLNQIRIAVPPLRDRCEDIAPMARWFLAREREGMTIAEDAVEALRQYGWPGNIRELKSLMALLAVTVNSNEVRLADLPPAFLSGAKSENTQSHSLDKLEEEVIFDALTQAAGRRDRAAEMLGISTRTLIRK